MEANRVLKMTALTITEDRLQKVLGFCLILILGLTLGLPIAHAQKMKVDKVKGNKAIVTFSGHLESGQTYDLGGAGASTSGKGGSSAMGARNNLIGLTASLSSLTTSVSGSSVSSTTMIFTGYYGWNQGQTEYGILGEFANSSSGGISSTSFGGGGFFDYDFIPNRPGTEMVYGVGAQGKIGSTNNGSTTSMYWEVLPTGFMKWFVLKTTTCIRADLGFDYRSVNSSPAVTTSGLLMTAGLAHYF